MRNVIKYNLKIDRNVIMARNEELCFHRLASPLLATRSLRAGNFLHLNFSSPSYFLFNSKPSHMLWRKFSIILKIWRSQQNEYLLRSSGVLRDGKKEHKHLKEEKALRPCGSLLRVCSLCECLNARRGFFFIVFVFVFIFSSAFHLVSEANL
jgi:hypothetical protein